MKRALVRVSGGIVQQVTHDEGVEVRVFDEDNFDEVHFLAEVRGE